MIRLTKTSYSNRFDFRKIILTSTQKEFTFKSEYDIIYIR